MSDALAEVDTPQDDRQAYCAMSKMAVVSLILAILSPIGLVFSGLLLIPAIAAALGIVSLMRIRRYSYELTGRLVALLGTVGAVVVLLGGIGFHTVVYVTEVPEGYERISFSALQPEGRELTSELARQMDGKKVFVTGYVHPGVSGMGRIKSFVLVRDMKLCCFGGQPKASDMIEVEIVNDKAAGVAYNQRRRKLTGTFRLREARRPAPGKIFSGYYALEADWVK